MSQPYLSYVTRHLDQAGKTMSEPPKKQDMSYHDDLRYVQSHRDDDCCLYNWLVYMPSQRFFYFLFINCLSEYIN